MSIGAVSLLHLRSGPAAVGLFQEEVANAALDSHGGHRYLKKHVGRRHCAQSPHARKARRVGLHCRRRNLIASGRRVPAVAVPGMSVAIDGFCLRKVVRA